MNDPLKLGVLISGSGSNLQSIIDHIEKGSLNAIIKIVISNNSEAYGITRAKKHGLPVLVFNHKDYKTREDFDLELIKALNNNNVQLVVLAGFMRILTTSFMRAFPQRIINIHPALLPAFPGTHVQKKRWNMELNFPAALFILLMKGVDTGPIIIQSVLPVLDDDTEETLAARILKEEHRIYPQAIQFYADGKIGIDGRKVKIKSANKTSFPALHNPPLAGY